MASFFAYYPPGSSSTNASVSPNGQPIPADSTLVAGENPSGNQQPLQTDNAGNLLVSIASEPGQPFSVNLTEVGGAAITEGQKTSANSLPVVIASDQSTLPVSAASLPLPTGAATSANQTNGSQETQIVQGGNTVSVTAASALKVDGSAVTQPISASALPLPTGASTSALQSNVQSAPGSSAATAITIQGSATGVAVPVSISGTTPISGTVTANQGTANATPWNQNISQFGGSVVTIGQQLSASSIPVVLPASQISTLTPLSTVTVIQPTAANLNATVTGSVAVSSSALPTGASTSALQSNVQSAPGTPQTIALTIQGNASGVPVPISGSISATNPSVGLTGTTAPTSATESGGVNAGNLIAMSVDASGNQNVNVLSSVLPTGAATSANQTNASQKTQIVDGSGNVIASTSNALNVNVNNAISTSIGGTAIANAPIENVYSTTNITTATYVQLVASTANAINTIHIFDSSGQAMILGVGASGSEVIQLYVQPGGDVFTLKIPAGSRIAYKALTGNATSGYLLMSFLE